jgi:hypothetical protein
VIFITDGVANVFLDGVFNRAEGCGADVPECQVGYVPNTNPRKPRPITEMGIEAASLRNRATIYVIALADVPETGLRNVASDTEYPYYQEAPTGAELGGIFDSIRTDATEGPCVPHVGDWLDTMAPENVGTVPGSPLPYPRVGYVTLRYGNGNSVPNGNGTRPIEVVNGHLWVRFNNLTAGTYQMTGWVAYRGSDDRTGIYSRIWNVDTQETDSTYTFELEQPRALGTVVQKPRLHLDLNGAVCAQN